MVQKFNSYNDRKYTKNDNSVLVLNRKSVSRLIALLMLLFFFVFLAGYFLGKKKAVETFGLKVEQDAFADQISVALNTLYDHAAQVEQEVEVETGLDKKEGEALAKSEDPMEATPVIAQVDEEVASIADNRKYQAQLLGGKSKDITAFVDRLSKKGIAIEAKRRSGKTAKGRSIVWHQAVTPIYSSKEELDTLLEQIQKYEKLNDIRIVELT